MATDDLDQLAHDLLDEAHQLILSMALTGRLDERVTGLIARIRNCAEQAQDAAKEKTAQHLRDVILELEKPPAKPGPP